MTHQFEKKILLSGRIIAESGIMIGGSNSALEIGGTDKQVIRNPLTKIPYIPGSSLKGKMRSLLELREGTINIDKRKNAGPTHRPEALAAQLFGYIKNRQDNDNQSQQASRVIVRDSEMTNHLAFEAKTELLYTEVKAENSIDRITSAANPRFFERVPKGAEFDLEIILNIYSTDTNWEKYLPTLFDCLIMVQDDYLGGGGSRGNGQIRFALHKIVERDKSYYSGEREENDISNLIPDELK